MNQSSFFARITRELVTEEQLDACSRVIDLVKKEVFYQVKSATTVGTVYEVRYNRERHLLTCTCPAGQTHFNCWHRRAAVIAEREYKRLKRAEQQAKQEQLPPQPIDEIDPRWVAYLKSSPTSWARHELSKLKEHGLKAYESEGFSFLKK